MPKNVVAKTTIMILIYISGKTLLAVKPCNGHLYFTIAKGISQYKNARR
jgi:hypothetical protein